MQLSKKIATHSYWLLAPILLFNIFFGQKLIEVGYLANDVNIGWIGVAEFVLRICVFALPLLIWIDYKKQNATSLIIIYIIGTLLYFASWLTLIYLPNSELSQNWGILLAPAYLPLIWMSAIALLGIRSKWFIPVILLFTIVHTYSTYLKLK